MTAIAGLLVGLLVYALTAAASQSDIGGPGWTLRGNGALVVLFGLLPGLLAAGWVWLAARSLTRAALAGLVALALELGFGFGPILLMLAPTGAAYILVPILIPILVATPVLAGRWTGRLAAESATLTVATLLGAFGSQYLLGPR